MNVQIDGGQGTLPLKMTMFSVIGLLEGSEEWKDALIPVEEGSPYHDHLASIFNFSPF